MFDILSIGDATQDIFLTLEEDTGIIGNQLCVPYGEKIPVKKIDISVGGNAGNTAIGLARLGLRTAFLGILGDDFRGNWIRQELLDNSVDIAHVVIANNKQSNQSVIINYRGERTIFTYHEPYDNTYADFPESKWIYLTSKCRNKEDLYEKVLQFKKNNPEIRIAFNPGTRELKQPEEIDKILPITDILFLNKEEGKGLTNKNNPEEILKILSIKIKPEGYVVLTDGVNGSYVIYQGQGYYQEAIPVKVVEKTGAGDSFAAAFTAAIFYEKNIQTALIWGSKNSASVISCVGHYQGLLRKEEM